MPDVVMPQMGESIAEGTVVRWIKKVGDSVDRDEPLFEISTDKVDAEIPSPAAGILTDIKVREGETVPVNSVVAVIGGPAASAEAPRSPAERAGGPDAQAAPGGAGEAPQMPAAAVGQPEASDAATDDSLTDPDDALPEEELRRQKSSPLVRRIAKEHDVDIRLIKGTGISGRVTKQDILGFLESGRAAGSPDAAAGSSTPPEGGRAASSRGANVEVVPMSVMRRKIAEHMVLSARTSPHVYSVYEVNFGRLAAVREKHKAAYEAAGTKLTFTALIARVIVDALRTFPVVNASIDGDQIIYKKDINLGIAVALDSGLLVPVIRRADEKNLLGLSRAIDDLAQRARSKKLVPEEVQHGTFTITNPGVFGALYGLPLINQPQVAILGVGAIDKRAVVVDDAIAIRPVCHLTLGYDHRLIDGADAGRFLTFVKERLEGFEDAWV